MAGAVLLAAATVILRLYHQTTSYELFVDEIQYADVGNAFAAGRPQELFGAPFFLHPPLFFALLGTVIGEPVPHLTVEFVLGLRWVELVFAACNCLLVVAIARRVAGRAPALLAGALYALDPFIVRFDSRLLLEAPTMTASLLGILAATIAVQSSGPGRQGWLVAAGLAFGVAITTKSTAALITTVPLLLMLATAWGLRRREALLLIELQCGVYAVYILSLGIGGDLDEWFDQTVGGVLRATGVTTETGFNSVGAPSFTDRLVANLTQFAPSYLLIAVAVGYIGLLLFDRIRTPRTVPHTRVTGIDETARFMTGWLVGVVVAMTYTFGFGEVEEQTFYLLAVPSTIAIAMLVRRTASWAVARDVATAAVIGLLATSSIVWSTVHTRQDDAYLRLEQFLAPQAGRDTVLALGEHTAQFVLPGFGIVPLLGADQPLPTVPPVRYALVSTQLSALGLAPVSPEVVDELEKRYPAVFRATGRTVGELRLYDLTAPRSRS